MKTSQFRTYLAVGAMFLMATSRMDARGTEVLVVTDLGPNGTGAAFVAPSAEAPCAYIFRGGIERTLGEAVANEQIPRWDDVRAVLEPELTRQHYVRTEVGGPIPKLVLFCSWGAANLVTDEFEETDDESGETTTTSVNYNARELARLAGVHKARQRQLSLVDADRQNTVLNEDRLYILIAALDAQALARKERRLVWRTWISIPSLRHSLPRELAVMMKSAGPHFGRDTGEPVFVDDRVRNAEVEIGDATVMETDVTVPQP